MKCEFCENESKYEITYKYKMGLYGYETESGGTWLACSQHAPNVNENLTNKIIQQRKENSDETSN